MFSSQHLHVTIIFSPVTNVYFLLSLPSLLLHIKHGNLMRVLRVACGAIL
jgi:hypothetical protein